MIVVIYRIGCVLPVPYIDNTMIEEWFNTEAAGTMLQYLNILSGSAFAQATLFALSVSPYITSSIVIQLLTIAIPALERLSKEGEEGKKKISLYTKKAIIKTTIYMDLDLTEEVLFCISFCSTLIPNILSPAASINKPLPIFSSSNWFNFFSFLDKLLFIIYNMQKKLNC